MDYLRDQFNCSIEYIGHKELMENVLYKGCPNNEPGIEDNGKLNVFSGRCGCCNYMREECWKIAKRQIDEACDITRTWYSDRTMKMSDILEKQQIQIHDLIQRNRSLEATIEEYGRLDCIENEFK